MFLAFVAAMGNVGLEDVAVAGFEFLQDGGFVDDTRTAVIGECAEKNRVLAVSGIHGAELGEVFAEESVCLFLGDMVHPAGPDDRSRHRASASACGVSQIS